MASTAGSTGSTASSLFTPSTTWNELGVRAEAWGAERTLRWAETSFAPRLTLATGFGAEGCVIIDLVARMGLAVDIFTLDTGVLFPETYDLWKRLEERYGITIKGIRPAQTLEEQAQTHGDNLWERAAREVLRAAQGRAARPGARRATTPGSRPSAATRRRTAPRPCRSSGTRRTAWSR